MPPRAAVSSTIDASRAWKSSVGCRRSPYVDSHNRMSGLSGTTGARMMKAAFGSETLEDLFVRAVGAEKDFERLEWV